MVHGPSVVVATSAHAVAAPVNGSGIGVARLGGHRRGAAVGPVAAGRAGGVGAGARVVAAVGFELPHDIEWPIQALNAHAGWSTRIEGTAQERRNTLDRLAQTRPWRVLVACNAAATPDRGTARFIRAAVPDVARGGLLLLGHASPNRWQNWLDPAGLEGLAIFTDAAQAHAWLLGDSHA